MKRLIFIFLPVLVLAEQPSLTIANFRGLNTAKSDSELQPNELRVCHNATIKQGELYVQDGVVPIFTFPGADSITSVGTMSFRNGNERLVAVVDSAGVGYANIYVSQMNTDYFGNSTDSTYIALLPSNRDSVNVAVIVIDSFFVKNDTIVIRDTAIDAADFLTVNDTLVARINAHSTLNNYVTAGLGAAPNADTTYFFTETYSDTNVTFRKGELGRHPELFFYVPISIAMQTITTFSGGISPSQRIATHWSTTFPTDFDQFNDNLYIVNGQQRAKVYNGDYVSDWPASAPGEVSFVPLAGSGSPNGSFRYIIKYSLDSTDFADTYGGYVTPDLQLLNQDVLLEKFPLPALPNIGDTFAIKIYRSKGDVGRLTETDYAYLIKQINFLDTSNIFDLSYSDTASDASLSATDSIPFYDPEPNSWTGRQDELLDSAIELRFGAPIFIASDSVSTAGDSGIFDGAGNLIIGVRYIVNNIDTTTKSFGDSSRSLTLYQNTFPAGTLEESYTIGLPKGHNSNNVIKNIWRSHIMATTWDTLKAFYSREDTLYLIGNTEIDIDTLTYPLIAFFQAVGATFFRIMNGDTASGEFRLIAQVADSQSQFKDTIKYSDWTLQPEIFRSQLPPSGIEQVFIHDERLFAVRQNTIWNSRKGLLNEWELFDFSRFNLDDGDQINMAEKFRGGILVGKNFSAYNLLPEGDWTVNEVAGVPGCVAARSPLRAWGALYYMSTQGVVTLSEGAALLRYHEQGLLSKPLKNFTEMSFDQLRTAVGAYVPQTEQLWWSVGDTTYIYDRQEDVWTTSSLVLGGSTLFTVDTSQAFSPGRTLYFYRPNDSVLYKFGEGHKTPAGLFVNMIVQTGPLFPDAASQQILRYALWTNPEITYALLAVNFLNQGDTLTLLDESGGTAWSLPRVDRSISFMEVYAKPAIYYKLYFQSLEQLQFPMRDGGIKKIDIWTQDLPDEITWK